MANRVAWLTKRVKIEGKWLVRKPVVKASGLVTNRVHHNGRVVEADGIFVLEWYDFGKRQRLPLSTDASAAEKALRQKTNVLQARSKGLDVVEAPEEKGKTPLRKAVEDYVALVKAKHAHKTYLAYKRALGLLVQACPKVDFVEDLQSIRHLQTAFIAEMSKEGLGRRSQENLFGVAVTFLHAHDHKIVTRHHGPKAKKRTGADVTIYTKEELAQYFGACSAEERLKFQFFLFTGCREQEVMHANWRNVDTVKKQFKVTDVPEYAWKPKDKDARDIPIPDSLVRDLKAWKDTTKKSFLLFPRSDDRPNGHILRECKAIALRAGLNCGHCKSTLEGKAVTCATHPVCENWFLHKFRHTFACMHLLAGVNIRRVQAWLGHSDLETTSIYLEAIAHMETGVRDQVNNTFADVPLAAPKQTRLAVQ